MPVTNRNWNSSICMDNVFASEMNARINQLKLTTDEAQKIKGKSFILKSVVQN